MLIPSARAALLRNYQSVLFSDETHPVSERRYVFYLLLQPILQWVKPILRRESLEADEIESEIFLLCAKIYDLFDSKKSSLVPYLEKQIPWSVEHLTRRFKKKVIKTYSVPADSIIDEEFYWYMPNILIEDRYVGKVFTRAEKYIISKILTSDDDKLTQVDIAKQLGVNRITANRYLSELREKLQTYWRI
jgi:hypothetical protein